jgi:hypothetical protein
MVHFDANGQNKEGYKIELPIFGNTQFYVFEVIPKEQRQPAPQATAAQYPEAEIDPSSIPY